MLELHPVNIFLFTRWLDTRLCQQGTLEGHCRMKDSSSRFWKWKWQSLSRVWLFATPWTIQSMEFSRQEYWSGQPFPSAGDFPNPGTEARSSTFQANFLTSWTTREAQEYWRVVYPFSSMSSPSRNQTGVSCVAVRFFSKWAVSALVWFHLWFLWFKATRGMRPAQWQNPLMSFANAHLCIPSGNGANGKGLPCESG